VTKNAPFLGEPTVIVQAEPGTRPQRGIRRGRHRRLRLGAQRDLALASWPPCTGVEGADADALVLIDATSGAGVASPSTSAQSDVYYFAPQKCVRLPTVASGSRCSRRPHWRAWRRSRRSGRWVPDFYSACRRRSSNSRKDQTYNTPAVATLAMMAEQLRWMNDNGGLEFTTGRTADSSSRLYDWADASSVATPFVTDPAARSQVVGTIDFDDSIDAAAIAKVLRANGIVDTEPYRKLGRNQLRIAMFPAVDPDDISRLTGAIDFILDRL
jgi:phosphoserine aminotransferase